MVLSLGFAAYQLWAIRSDAAAKQLYLQSDSCALVSADSNKPAPSGVCRREFTVVTGRQRGAGRGISTHLYLFTASASGSSEKSWLTTYNAREFWGRVQPDDRIAILRFVAPGYHLSGRIIAMRDGIGDVGTANRPDSNARGEGFLAALALFVSLFSFVFYRAAVIASRESRPHAELSAA